MGEQRQAPPEGKSVFHFGVLAIVARLSAPIALSARRAERHCPV